MSKLQYIREARSNTGALEWLRGHLQERAMPKRNYGFEKRQKELNKQKKQEEKRQRKQERAEAPAENATIEETVPEADLDQ